MSINKATNRATLFKEGLSLGSRIRKAIKFAGVTQEKFAKLIVVDKTLLSRYINDKVAISANLLAIIAEKTNVDGHWLLTGKLPQSSENSGVSAHAPLLNSAVPDEMHDSINQLLFALAESKTPAKVKNVIKIIKILGDLPNKKVETLLKVAQGFKEEKRGGE